MIFDDELNLYLMEVNMSPNLLHLSYRLPHKYMYENLLYNLFNLLDISNPIRDHNFLFPDGDVEMMAANPNSFGINPEICVNEPCLTSCSNKMCRFCLKCLSSNDRFEMIMAYREQMNVGEFTRIFPPSIDFLDNAGSEFWNNVTEKNEFYIEWFEGMCKKNRNFC
jgi:hypothetical protein